MREEGCLHKAGKEATFKQSPEGDEEGAKQVPTESVF